MSKRAPPHLASTYNSSIRKSLVLPEFFESEDPCEWNAISYLTQLVQQYPTISIRSGNKALYDDIDLMRAHVVPGTVAESTLRQIEISMKTRKANDIISDFWKSSRFIASSTVQYAAQKHRLRGHMADEMEGAVVDRCPKRQCPLASDQSGSDYPDDDGEMAEDEDDDIQCAWKILFKDLQDFVVFPPRRSERDDAIWCGKQTHRPPSYPDTPYAQLNDDIDNISLPAISPYFHAPVSEAVDAVDEEAFSTAVQNFRNRSTNLNQEKNLIETILEIFLNLYDGSGEMLSASENCLRFYVVDPLLQACNRYLEQQGHKVLFFPGEIELTAMTKQLRLRGIMDGRLKYNADGKIQLRGNGLELLLSEVSSSYGINDKGKTSFDRYKAMFGLLAMLRTIAAHYQYAEFSTFSKFKVHFIHTHNRAIRHWTMFTPAPGLYVMNKEQKVDIIADFEQKETAIVPLINFTNTLAVSLVDTMDVLSMLAEEHGKVMKETRFDTQRRRPSLLQHIQPVIVRLNESKHTTDIADDGPKSPLYIPNH